jgi:hypothetical protein
MKAIGVRAEQTGRTHGRYRPALHDNAKSPCQQDAVHTWDRAALCGAPSVKMRSAAIGRLCCKTPVEIASEQ